MYARPAELVALVLALEERDRLDAKDRRRLDREIGRRHPQAQGLALIRAWLAEAPTPALHRRIERVNASLTTLTWLLLAIGFFLGWATAAGLLSIEVHEGRINIILCLALIVMLPLGMLLFSLFVWLVSFRSGGASQTQSTIGDWLRGARMTRFALRLLAPSIRPDAEIVLGRLEASRRLYGGVQRGQFFLWSQSVAIGFGLGAVIATLGFVLFTDLAFGWSTTLDIDAARFHRLVEFLAAPWARIWSAAAPSLELVESTRFFRVLADNHVHFIDPIVFGGWWPFLVMAIVFYSILPRALALLGTTLWLRRATARAIRLTPGVDRLLDRLMNPIVDSRAESGEAETGRGQSGWVPDVDGREWLRERGGSAPMVVRWAEVMDDASLSSALGLDTIRIRDAGGRRSLDQDAEIIEAAAATSDGIVVCVRAAEPPVLDQLDFLESLRHAVGLERNLCVFLFGGSERDHGAWRRKLMSLGDPVLSVATFPLD